MAGRGLTLRVELGLDGGPDPGARARKGDVALSWRVGPGAWSKPGDGAGIGGRPKSWGIGPGQGAGPDLVGRF